MLVAGVAEDGRGARGVEENGIWRKKRGKERANGKVWGGIGGEFGEDWVDGRLRVRSGRSGRWGDRGEKRREAADQT